MSTQKEFFTQEQLCNIKELYESGNSPTKIALIYNTSFSTIKRRLSDMGVLHSHPRVTDERKQLAIKTYQECQNLSQTEKKINMNRKTIRRILNEAGIKILNMAEIKTKCKINEDYFKVIDTPRKSYYLGLLYADGCASDRNHSIQISLQERDKHIIESFNNDIGSDYKIRFVDMKKKSINYSNQYNLCITNEKFYNNLVNLGLIPHKSLILQFPDFLDPSLVPSFLLGYMDGDGSINKKEGRCSLIGTESFCKKVAEIVNNELGIHASISLCHNNSTSTTRECRISGRKQAKKFLDWLYNNSDIWLERKYQSYLEMCEKCK